MIDGDSLSQLAQTDTHINDIKAIGELSTSLGISANSNFMIWLVGKATYTAKIPSSNLKITRQVYLSRKTMMKTSLLLSIRFTEKFS